MFIIIVIIISQSAYSCEKILEICTQGPATRVIDGRSIYRDCWQYETEYSCIDNEYKDYCQAIRQVPGCTQVDSTCVQQDESGKCLEYRDTFKCGNLLSNKNLETKLLDSEYTITKDELDSKECQDFKNCHEIESTCVEGPETKNINDKDVYKDCWKYTKKYACFAGSKVSDCKGYEGKCTPIGQQCLSESKDGVCTHLEKQYECMKLTGNKPISMNCKTSQYCIGDNCTQNTYTPNSNMGRAISALSILGTVRKDMGEEECGSGASNCKIFKGVSHTCRMNPIGSRNCCKDKGWANDLKLTDCNESERVLAKKKETNLCHHVGSYCAKKVAGICLEKKQSYCCFNSKIARIIHEQGRKQLGISWGTAKAPNCAPLTIEQLQKINFDNIDLSELYTELTLKINLNTHSKIDKAAKASVSKQVTKANAYQDEIARRVSEHYGK